MKASTATKKKKRDCEFGPGFKINISCHSPEILEIHDPFQGPSNNRLGGAGKDIREDKRVLPMVAQAPDGFLCIAFALRI